MAAILDPRAQGATLAALVTKRGQTWHHELRVNGEVAGTRRSRTRQYTHVVANKRPDGSWSAWSWHLSAAAAHAAAPAHWATATVVEVAEVTP